MRASNYTPVDAVKKLHEELDKLFAGKTFSGQGKNKPLNIFDFEFPTDFGNDEDVDTVAAAAPFILVKAAGWSIDKMEEPEMVDMSLSIFCIAHISSSISGLFSLLMLGQVTSICTVAK